LSQENRLKNTLYLLPSCILFLAVRLHPHVATTIIAIAATVATVTAVKPMPLLCPPSLHPF
jgi:hypothetical protein